MEREFRDTMSNLGDIFIEKLEKGRILWKQSTKGILKAYNVRLLKMKRKKIINNIGERLVEVRDASPGSEVFRDDKLLELFERLYGIEACIKENIEE